jgi:hypothetical protein
MAELSNFFLPQRIASLTSIEILWEGAWDSHQSSGEIGNESFDRMWTILDSIPSLQKLKVAIVALPRLSKILPRRFLRFELQRMKSMNGRGLKEFQLYVPPAYRPCIVVDEDSPFTLKTLPGLI